MEYTHEKRLVKSEKRASEYNGELGGEVNGYCEVELEEDVGVGVGGLSCAEG